MMLTIANVLDAAQVQQCRQLLEQAEWSDGRATAGHLAVKAKRNLQLPADSVVGERIGELILAALGRTPRFMAAALPLKVFPPRFNCYQHGGEYGHHVDNAIFSIPGSAHRIRGDLSASLFFNDPDQYDGGELIIEDSYGQHSVKLPAGHMVLYPSSSLHRVSPVTRGARYASFFWIQSLVREASQRSMLLELDDAIQALTVQLPDSAELARLTGVYHNLLRRWAQT